ncbi:VCBS repeat-containing protein [Cecembia rubra]|uniref:VCBS repeat-containing protein n=1 Tax=Cecembia rubra TaxID=1485585 RepID=UPI002714C51E|nr:VCBS repeat-containing protein [Cecembia rubra]
MERSKYKAKLYINPFFIGMVLWACHSKNVDSTEETLFTSIKPSYSGVDFSNELVEEESFNIIEYLYFYNGAGIAVGDINNDGLLDIYFSSNQQGNQLYLNKGNLQFEDITEKAGLVSPGPWKTGVSMVDINGDGFLDIYLCRVSGYKGLEGKNELYINNGDLTFTESAELYGLDFKGFSTQAAFFDYDGDGDLDMYLLNHAVHTERSFGRAALRYIDNGQAGDKLYRNNLDKGEIKFSAVSNEAGIFSSQVGYGLGIGIADLNKDGWPDIYVSNDFNENDYLYINQKDGTFKESISKSLTYSSRFSMGNDLADINNDTWIDIMTLDMLPEDEKTQKMSVGEDPYEIFKLKLNFGYERQASRNMLQLNNADGTYSEIAQLAGLYATDWSWAVLLADFDNDGLKDVFISNGIKLRPNDVDYINFITGATSLDQIKNLDLAAKMPEGLVPNYFFKNSGNLQFQDVSKNWGISQKTISNGAVYADLDNDGDLDLIVNHINKKAEIFKNQTIEMDWGNGSNFIKVRFSGNGLNVFGIGAKVIAYSGDLSIYQENYTSRGFQSSTAPEIHIGLGQIKTLDSLVVIWPDQSFQKLEKIKANQTLTLNQFDAYGNFEFTQLNKPVNWEIISTEESGLDFVHEEDDYNDFNLESLLPHKISREGPAALIFDFNGDGLEDVFLGGASGQEPMIYLQNKNGRFKGLCPEELSRDADLEDITVIWEDFDQDGLPDLIVGRGGNIHNSSPNSHSKFYRNLGNGELAKGISLPLDPNLQVAKFIPMDIDQDGLLDLFVGGRNCAGRYGEVPQSYLLKNIGNGLFEDWTKIWGPEIQFSGMVKDASWVDLNQDGSKKLIVIGEWMPVKIYGFEGIKLVDQTHLYGLENTNGWWNTIRVHDIDKNGFPDFILGNIGKNTRLKSDALSPLKMWVKDLDNNGSLDQVIAYPLNHQYFPLANRDELVKRLPAMKKEFVRNSHFAGKTIEQVFKKTPLDGGAYFEAKEFSSQVWLNMNGKFEIINLPIQAQFAPVQAIHVQDLDGDGLLDLITGGNFIETAPYFGAYLGSWGNLFKGDGKGNFVPFQRGTLGIYGQIKHILQLKVKEELWTLFIRNDDKIEILRFQQP